MFLWKKAIANLVLAFTFAGLHVGVSAFPANAESIACGTGGSFEFASGVVSNGESCQGSLVIPAGATSIAEGAFVDAVLITTVSIPASVTSIGPGSFSRFGSLSSFTVDAGNPNYSSDLGVLYDKNKTLLIHFPVQSELTTFVIPNTVTGIGNDAFHNARRLTQITFGTQIASIGGTALGRLGGLNSFVVPDGNANFSSRDGVLFNKLQTELIQFPLNSAITSYVIPNTVVTIKQDAFFDAESITNITVPNSVITIEDRAFYGASSLSSITLGNNLTTIGEFALAFMDSLTSIVFPDSVTTLGTGLMQGNESLTSATLPAGLVSIPDQAFTEARALTSITIPSTVTTIGDNAFYQARSLTSVTFPAGLTSIGQWAFENAINLSTVTFLGMTAPTAGSRSFRNVASGATVMFPLGATGFCNSTTWYGLVLAGDCPNCSAITGGNVTPTEEGWQLSWDEVSDVTNIDNLDIFIVSATSSDSQAWYNNTDGLEVSTFLNRTSTSHLVSKARVVELLNGVVNEYSLNSFRFNVRKNNGTASCYVSTRLGTVSIPTFSLTSSSESTIVNSAAVGFSVNASAGDFSSFTINSLPTGMSFDSASGTLRGTPRDVKTSTTYIVSSANSMGLMIRRTFSLTVTRDLAEEARLAKQAEIAQAKADIQTSVKAESSLTLEVIEKAEINGATSRNLPLINRELAELSAEKRGDFVEILRIIRKYEVVDILASSDVNRIQSHLLVEIRLIPSDSKNKTSLVSALRKLSPAERSTYETLKAAINLELQRVQARKDRTAAIKKKINSKERTSPTIP
jgi:hypothetical protein